MLKVFFVFALTINLYSSNILDISENFIKQNSLGYIYFIEDSKNEFTSEDILLLKNLKLAKKIYRGISKGAFWTKIELRNSSKEFQNLAFFNSLAGTNKIDVYIYKNNKLIKTHKLGDLREQNQREIISRYSMFRLKLEKNENITIIAKIKNYHLHNIGWTIQKDSYFIQNETYKLFIFGMLMGIVVLFVLYNILAYTTYKEFTFFLIALNIVVSSIYLYSFNGVLYFLDLGINLEIITSITWNLSNFSLILLMLFPLYFFNMKERYVKLSYVLKVMIAMHLLITMIVLYAQYVDEKYFSIFNVLFFFIIFNILFLFCMSAYMYFKKESGSSYYFFGQGILFVGMTCHASNLFGLISYNEINKYFYPIGITIDLFFMTLVQFQKTKNKLLELKKKKEHLLEQSRFSSMGQAIGHITHQWKHPLTNLGTSLTLLESIYRNKQETLLEHFEEQLPSLKNDINFMKNIIDEFSSFYSSKVIKNNFSPKESIKNIKKMINSKILLKNTQIEIKTKNIEYIYGFEHIFSNIMLILIDNSLDEFTNAKNNKITINIEKIKDAYKIEYQDNAGGIKIKPIDKIFEYSISSKINKENSGTGLPILKMLVEDRLEGYINVENTKNGVFFKIYIS